jgi:hypothetical protein
VSAYEIDADSGCSYTNSRSQQRVLEKKGTRRDRAHPPDGISADLQGAFAGGADAPAAIGRSSSPDVSV